MKKILLIFSVLFFLAGNAGAQWNKPQSLPGTDDGTTFTTPRAVSIPTMESGASTYNNASSSVTIDLSKTWHYVNLTPATVTTGVSILWTGTPTLTSQNRTVYISLKQAGSVAGKVVWTGATEHDSGTSPVLTTTVGARDVFAVVLSSEAGTTKTVHPAGSEMK